jgi:hypothetical protein
MGTVCSCLEEIREDQFIKERLDMLQKGDKFMRSIYLGLSSQELFVQLSDDLSKITWRVNSKSKDEHGEIDLTTQIKIVKASGHQGLHFTNADGKVILDIQADETSKRDKWMVALNELLQRWENDPKSKPKSSLSAAGTSNKNEYFKLREDEIIQREKEAIQKKMKYNTAGMKYTAQIMSSR